jgi:hypothetical protein
LNILLGRTSEHGQLACGAVSAEERKSPTGGDRLLHVQPNTAISHEKSASYVSGGMG